MIFNKKELLSGSVFWYSGFILACLIASVLVVSGNIIAISLFCGLVLGGVLLLRPVSAATLVIFGGMVIVGFIALALPQLNKAAWLFSILGFFLLLVSLGQMFSSYRHNISTPAFIWLALMFIVYSMVVGLLAGGGGAEAVAGFKRYFQAWGLMFFLAWGYVDQKKMNFWLKALFVLCLLQFPVALFQLIVLVPKRVGMGNGVVPIDIVSGTFEASMDGGGSSSVLVTFVIAGIAYVIAAWQEKLMTGHKALAYGTICAIPLFLGETKIVLVYLPLLVFVLFGGEIKKRPVMTIFALLTTVVLVFVLAWLYLSTFSGDQVPVDTKIEKIIAYNFGDAGYYDKYSLNRTTVLTHWFKQHGLIDPLGTLFGHGMGSSYNGVGTLVAGHMDQKYAFLAIGLTTASSLLWDFGFLGLLLYVAVFWNAWLHAKRLYLGCQDAMTRAVLQAVRLMIAMTAVLTIYSNSYVITFSLQVMAAFSLGYVAWLDKQASIKNSPEMAV